jgi:cell fate regulator YaaT (PSP1 superfamily)
MGNMRFLQVQTDSGIRLRCYVEAENPELTVGAECVVDAPRVQEFATVTYIDPTPSDGVDPVDRCKVLRLATEEDRTRALEVHALAGPAHEVCQELIITLGLPMKLVRTYFGLDKSKVVFEFSAEGRVDFRQLVRELASRIRMRVELRQIGVRDASKIAGGTGVCGRRLCCSSWMNEFDSINVRMAKDQQLNLTPGNVSGLCGRLKCCLQFEHDVYRRHDRELPRRGACVRCAQGEARVVDRFILKRSLVLQFEDQRLAEVGVDEVELLSQSRGNRGGGSDKPSAAFIEDPEEPLPEQDGLADTDEEFYEQ